MELSNANAPSPAALILCWDPWIYSEGHLAQGIQRDPCMHTWTETQDRKEMVFRKNIQPGFSIIFEWRSFLCSKYILFSNQNKLFHKLWECQGLGLWPTVLAQQNSPAPRTHAGQTGPVQYPWLTPNVCYQRHHTTAPVCEAFQRVWQHLIYPLGKLSKKNFNFFSHQKRAALGPFFILPKLVLPPSFANSILRLS